MFANGGVFAAVVTLLIAAWVACDNMIVLIKLAEYTGKKSYGQVCQDGCFFITLFYYRTGPRIRNRVFFWRIISYLMKTGVLYNKFSRV